MNLLKAWFTPANMLPKGALEGPVPSTREVYSKYIRIAVPSLLEMVLISLINMIDTVMVSSIGTDAVAAVGLVGQPRMLMLCIFFALNTGVTTVIARRKGENRREDANTVLRNAMTVTILLSAAILVLFLPFARPLMAFAGGEEGRTMEDATIYFLIISAALPFNTLSMVICAAQRGCGNTRLTMYVNILSNLVNVLFNWLLINGIGPFPRMGVTGAAIATAIGLVCGFVLCVISMYGKKGDTFLRLTFRKLGGWKLQKEPLQAITKIASASMVEQIALRIGFFSYAKIVAGLGTDAFAAHQICIQFLNLSYSCAEGLGVAGTSLVGQMLGAGRRDLSHMYGRLAQRCAFAVSLFLCALSIFGRGLLVSMFINETASDAVRLMAEAVMIVVGIFQPFQMLSVVASGALRGAGDVKYTARVMAYTVMLIRPLCALLFIMVLNEVFHRPDISLVGAWLGSLADILVRMFLFMRRYNSGRWQNIRV